MVANVDSDTVLLEPDQVSDMLRDLKNNINLAVDDIIPLTVVKEKLDAFTKAVDAFASA
ncbi:unnamed protein product [Effrenium voratum]|nr:unnamed protein product [Effrenium voratum]